MYILDLRHKDTTHVIMCMSLPISTTAAGELLKSLLLYKVLQLVDRQSIM